MYPNNLSHYGDIISIPLFGLVIVYFHKIKNKTMIEYILYYFSLSGFILDILYTIIFVYYN